MKLNVGIIGFGTVGKGFTKLLETKKDLLKKEYRLEPVVVAVADMKKGSIWEPKGIELNKLLELEKKTGRIDGYDAYAKGLESIELITETNAEVIVELTYTNLQTGEPAFTHIKTALNAGKHVITTNKGPTALYFRGLEKLSKVKNAHFLYEGTVMSGTPVFSLLREGLKGVKVKEVRGILNGTTNYILTLMEQGKTYEEALKDAQRKGYAEADPTGDVEGWDAAAKILILAMKLFAGELSLSDIDRKGITAITKKDIERAAQEGKRIKLLARAWQEKRKVVAQVKPESLELSDPLANIMGVTNALSLSTDILGEVTICGPGAGMEETGYAVLSDLIELGKRIEEV
jgi:homoserine dehydrogenase